MNEETRILSQLTEPQREAVTHPSGPLLIVAGAGSGKTRVVTHRVAHLVHRGIPPFAILAITFTNKAAQEMHERLERLGVGDGPWVSTFHSFCARQLRRFAHLIGYDARFTIFDQGDSFACIREAIRELKLDSEEWRPHRFMDTIRRWKEQLVDPDGAEEKAITHYERWAAKVYRLYEDLLRQRAALDFDDLLLKMALLLRDAPEARDALHDRFLHVLIDEYQDTNHTQYLIARTLAERHRNICVTGDPDQAIYQWRGADISNILDFESEYGDCRVIKLEQNYRSTQTILAAAQALIEQNELRKEKTLWTKNPRGDPIDVLSAASAQTEALAVVRRVQVLLNRGIPESEIGIFYRTNALSRNLEQVLASLGVPYIVVGAVEFYQRKEIKDILGYLKVLANPRDSLAVLRVLNTPPRGIGKTTVERLKEHARSEGLSLLEAIGRIDEIHSIRGRSRSAVSRFCDLIAKLRSLPEAPVADLLAEVIRKTDYRAYLQQITGPDDPDRIENVASLLGAAEEFDHERPGAGFLEFLEQVALVSDQDRFDPKAGRVSLMTVHTAKGLEFAHVFVIGMEAGLFPHIRSMDSSGSVEEERRLLYVAMTRAKERLTLSWARRRSMFGIEEVRALSSFLSELPQEILKEESDELPEESSPASWIAQAYSPFAPAVETGDDEPAFAVGDRVEHEHFGAGRVLSLSGAGIRTRVRVLFDRIGEKQLVLHYARLRKRS